MKNGHYKKCLITILECDGEALDSYLNDPLSGEEDVYFASVNPMEQIMIDRFAIRNAAEEFVKSSCDQSSMLDGIDDYEDGDEINTFKVSVKIVESGEEFIVDVSAFISLIVSVTFAGNIKGC